MARSVVTMADVGAAAGVSNRTVSNVLSGKVFVRPETREAVLRAVRDLGYQMNVSARGLRTGQTGFITLAIPDLAIDYFSELAGRVMLEAEAFGWTVTIQQTGARREREIAVLTGADRQLSDGLLFQPHALGPQDREALITDQPMVLLGDRIFHGPVDHVTMANTPAARAATEHLIASGRRRILAVGANPAGGPVSAAALRLTGYRQALEAAGLPLREELVAEAVDWRQAQGAAAVQAALERGVVFDAVFCFNDTLAFGALRALARAGRRIPDDVAVMGFDNVAAAEYSNPPLTTIDPGGPEIARRAMALLARRVHDGAAALPHETVTDFVVVERETT